MRRTTAFLRVADACADTCGAGVRGNLTSRLQHARDVRRRQHRPRAHLCFHQFAVEAVD
jgi:hypothetical protein